MKKKNKNKKTVWIFKSTTQMIVSIILFIVFIIGFIYIGTINFTRDVPSDHEKFIEEHKEVDIDNVYSYLTSIDAYTYIKGKDVIILFGTKNNDYVGYYANILNSVAKTVGLDNIYYYDITDDRNDKNATYQSITEYLSNYLPHLDDGTVNIYAPTLLVKKDNKIIYYDDNSAIINGNIKAKDYFDDYQTNLMKINLKKVLIEYMEETNNGEK